MFQTPRRKLIRLVSCNAWSMPEHGPYPLKVSWTTPGHTSLPLLQLWCESLCTASQQILLPDRRLFAFVWLAYCWISEINQLMTHTEKYQGWCKRGWKMHIQLEGGVGRWVKKKARKGETAFSYRHTSDRIHFQRELRTTFPDLNGMGNKNQYKKKNMVSFYKCKKYFSVSLKAYVWLFDTISYKFYLQWDF